MAVFRIDPDLWGVATVKQRFSKALFRSFITAEEGMFLWSPRGARQHWPKEMVSGAPSFSSTEKFHYFVSFFHQSSHFHGWCGERTDENNASLHPRFQVLNVSQVLNAGYCSAINTGCWVHKSMYVGAFKIRMVEDLKKLRAGLNYLLL